MKITKTRCMSAIILTLLVIGLLSPSSSSAAQEDFTAWLAGLRREALTKGISAKTFDTAFTGIQPIERVIELDRKQPEFTQTFWRYLDLRVTEKRVKRGRDLLQRHHELFSRINRIYGVQPRFLVAFWGLETNFGDYTGGYPVIGSLATLAYDERRSKFFRNELLNALSILERGDINPASMKGSWAGAMGQTQFMPSTFVRFAVDQDGDGRRDIWNSLPDIFGSAANFLSQSGWQGDKTWGREVRLPKDFNLELTGLDTEKYLSEWQALGIRRIDGGNLPAVTIKASLLLPSGYTGPAFLIYQNFRTILKWNRSNLYAVAVGHLADRLAWQEPLATARPATDNPLSRKQVIEIQNLLAHKGLNPGSADGIVGSQTRKAIKKFQRSHALPADGHPTSALLKILRTTR